ncbi:MAG: hypothetical protein AB8I08_20670 [Sandaracinaceae bacterium]
MLGALEIQLAVTEQGEPLLGSGPGPYAPGVLSAIDWCPSAGRSERLAYRGAVMLGTDAFVSGGSRNLGGHDDGVEVWLDLAASDGGVPRAHMARAVSLPPLYCLESPVELRRPLAPGEGNPDEWVVVEPRALFSVRVGTGGASASATLVVLSEGPCVEALK